MTNQFLPLTLIAVFLAPAPQPSGSVIKVMLQRVPDRPHYLMCNFCARTTCLPYPRLGKCNFQFNRLLELDKGIRSTDAGSNLPGHCRELMLNGLKFRN
jgi:hypothetical protein